MTVCLGRIAHVGGPAFLRYLEDKGRCMEFVEWLLTNVEKTTVTGILAFTIFALYKEWIVLGTTYRTCKSENVELKANIKRFEDEAATTAKETASELAALRRDVALSQQAGTRRGRTP